MFLQQVLRVLEFDRACFDFCATRLWNYLVLYLLAMGTPETGGVETTKVSTPHV